MTIRKIKLTAWGARYYDPPPSAWVLRRWARDGEITPAPELVGRTWYVVETAVRGSALPVQGGSETEERPARLTLVERLMRAEAGKR